MRRKALQRLHAAAAIFATRTDCTAQQIADRLKVSVDTIYGYARQKEWHETLDTLGFDGNREFAKRLRREALRDRPKLLRKARQIYKRHLRAWGEHSKAVNAVLRNLPEIRDRRTINRWSKRYNW